MDGFEFNKIAGAILGTALGVMALSIISDIIYEPGELTGPSYVIAVADTGESEVASGAEVEPIAVRLQEADIAAGERAAKKCLACHTFEPGGPAKVGPNLYGVVGGPAAHMDGFNYSDALRAAHDEGMVWGFDNLDDFLAAPKAAIPGTAMAFAGLRRPSERADVIAYLNSLAADPLPLPPPPAETAAAETEEGADAGTPAADGGDTAGDADQATDTGTTDSGTTDSGTTDSGTDATTTTAPDAADAATTDSATDDSGDTATSTDSGDGTDTTPADDTAN